MHYIIQYFKAADPECPSVGSWHNTAWGGDDLHQVMDTALNIVKTARSSPGSFAARMEKVRVVEVLVCFDCHKRNIKC